MRKKLLKSALIAMAWVGVYSGNVMATTVNLSGANGESILHTVFANKGWAIDANLDQITEDRYWQVSEGTDSGAWATMIIELAGNSAVNTFGIFDQSGNEQELMNGGSTILHKVSITWSAITGKLSFAHLNNLGDFDTVGSNITMDQIFGFYIGTPNGKLYSDYAKNGDGQDQMVSFAGTGANGLSLNHYIIAFEDILGGDRDFNDMVLLVESINPVPEPTTMLLFGAGLLGLAGVARRKSTN
ncbi:MAG: DUF4114 domain-containing protein [Desulfobulbus sp.]|uniref:DUF4114 domain-containing protein n=1 Tax=Desulfobulbus sp. TaxID=895 RepID=UPI00284078F3|nr:DUF4114 domain-containing protein [Desulfobulbus sp.]MDR2549208.1 DUF4114 domain-containing protein [Desulfobulbus sp.]